MTETPRQAEREVERARADLSQTLDALKEKLSLSHLFDEVRDQFMGSSGGEFTSNLSRQVRNNPMPAALVGLGVLGNLTRMAARDAFSPDYFTPVELGGLYWHLVDIVWIFLYPLLYLVSRA